MKNLLIWIILLFLFSCSSNPKIVSERDLEEQLIEKPQINYKLNTLPKVINVIYFADSDIKNTFPDEVKGLLTNYYLFSNKNKYFPTIKFINLNQVNSCSVKIDRETYNFFFLLHDSLQNQSHDLCLNKFLNRETLLVSNSKNIKISNKLRTYVVDRNEDKLNLIEFMSSYSQRIMVIDNEVTKDKYEIGEIWEKRFNKEISEYNTLSKNFSGQDIFSNMLLSEQSIKRKRKLSRIISKDLDLIARTREDIDTLFLSVSTQEARSLKPALDYSFFKGTEVFLLNDWRDDSNFLKTDKDLEGVISIDIPFMIPTSLPEDLKEVENKTRNFAIGYDAFEIALMTKGARNLNRLTYKGLTGKITFNDKSINRESTIFKIKDGIYEYLN